MNILSWPPHVTCGSFIQAYTDLGLAMLVLCRFQNSDIAWVMCNVPGAAGVSAACRCKFLSVAYNRERDTFHAAVHSGGYHCKIAGCLLRAGDG